MRGTLASLGGLHSHGKAKLARQQQPLASLRRKMTNARCFRPPHTVRGEPSVAHNVRVRREDVHHMARGDLPHPDVAVAGSSKKNSAARVPLKPLRAYPFVRLSVFMRVGDGQQHHTANELGWRRRASVARSAVQRPHKRSGIRNRTVTRIQYSTRAVFASSAERSNAEVHRHASA